MVPLIVNRDSESDHLRADGLAEDLRLARARLATLEAERLTPDEADAVLRRCEDVPVYGGRRTHLLNAKAKLCALTGEGNGKKCARCGRGPVDEYGCFVCGAHRVIALAGKGDDRG